MLKWVFGADTSPFRRSLNEMRNDVKDFSASARGNIAKMFAGGAIIGAAKTLIEHFARIQDLADRFGESAESIQRVGAAAEQAGMDTEQIAKAMTIATKNSVEAASAGGDMAESFSRLGIVASEFANMPLEDKLVALNAGYNASENSAQALSDVMKVMGKSGAEAIPLLTQSAEQLQKTLDDAAVAGDSTVASLAAVDDKIQDLKNSAFAAGAKIYDGFRLIAGTLSAVLGAAVMQVVNLFDTAMKVASNTGAGIKALLTGDLQGAADAVKNQIQIVKDGVGESASLASAAVGAIGDNFNDIFNNSGSGGGSSKVKDLVEGADAIKKTEEERKKLAEEIAKLEEDARIKSLSLAEKILDAEKRRAVLAADAIFGQDETAALEARKEQLKVEQEIAGYRKEQADLDEKTAKEKDDYQKKSAEEIQMLTEKGQELDRSNKLAGMSDRDKREFLKKERAQAWKQSKGAAYIGDEKGSLEAANKAKELTGQIDDLTRGLNSDLEKKLADASKASPMIATSSLAEIGGGGGVKVMQNDSQRRMVDLLAQIAANTAGGDEGSRPPEPI